MTVTVIGSSCFVRNLLGLDLSLWGRGSQCGGSMGSTGRMFGCGLRSVRGVSWGLCLVLGFVLLIIRCCLASFLSPAFPSILACGCWRIQ